MVKEFDPEPMNEAATEAEEALSKIYDNPKLEPGFDATAEWFRKWFAKAGHKRLGRILVSIAKDTLKGQPRPKPEEKKKKKGGK